MMAPHIIVDPATFRRAGPKIQPKWIDEVANQRVHGTTREQVFRRWDADQFNMRLVHGHPPYPYSDDELRKVARDAYVSWVGRIQEATAVLLCLPPRS